MPTMTTVNELRLAALYAAEVAALQAQAVTALGRSIQAPRLAEIHAEIKQVKWEIAREQHRAAGGGSLNYAVSNLSGE
jgi:capsule polysaccharide export protein KpsE/RkpR